MTALTGGSPCSAAQVVGQQEVECIVRADILGNADAAKSVVLFDVASRDFVMIADEIAGVSCLLLFHTVAVGVISVGSGIGGQRSEVRGRLSALERTSVYRSRFQFWIG